MAPVRGQTVRVAGRIGTELHGRYRVESVSPRAATIWPSGDHGRGFELQPRHIWLKDSEGAVVDIWSICNVMIYGAIEYIGLCSSEGDVLTITLDA